MMIAKTFIFTFNFHQIMVIKIQKSPLQMQDSCVHTNQHCYINTPGLQDTKTQTKTQRFQIHNHRTTKVKLHILWSIIISILCVYVCVYVCVFYVGFSVYVYIVCVIVHVSSRAQL